MVDRPELRHLSNVIVFSTKGERGLPSMLSGGDLDGDQFTLIWDSRLLPNANLEPFSYEAPPSRTTDEPVGAGDHRLPARVHKVRRLAPPTPRVAVR